MTIFATPDFGEHAMEALVLLIAFSIAAAFVGLAVAALVYGLWEAVPPTFEEREQAPLRSIRELPRFPRGGSQS
jgi:hypothetical protein